MKKKFELINKDHKKNILNLINKIPSMEISETASGLESIIKKIHRDIPEKKNLIRELQYNKRAWTNYLSFSE